MKKTIILLMMAIAFTQFAQAQQDPNLYSKALLELIGHAANDFKDVTGEMIAPIPGMEPAVAYTCKKGVGIGDEVITKNDSTGVAYYLLQIKKKDAIALIQQTNLLVDLLVQESKFTTEETKGADGEPTTVLKDKGGFKTLQIVTLTNDESEEELYGIFIFGKTLKESMKEDEETEK